MAESIRPLRIPWFVPLFNPIARLLLAAGVPMGPNVLITIPGRKSGLPRTTPLTIVVYSGRRWLMAPYGDVNWVRNLRVAGRATIIVGRRKEEVTAVELRPTETVAFFRDVLGPRLQRTRVGAWIVRHIDQVDFDHPEAAAKGRPVFELHPLQPQSQGMVFPAPIHRSLSSQREQRATLMQGEPPSTGETSERHALTLAPGKGLMGLSVYQIDPPHQATLVQTAEGTARQARTDGGLQGCAIFRAIGKGDAAVVTQWLDQRSYEHTEPTLLKPPQPDLYHIVLVDHITGHPASRLALSDGLFHFINVFRLTPSRRDDFVQYFEHLTRLVHVQPGYVSANLLISLDGCHAANIGQFQTRQAFLQAIFRTPRVTLGFAQGILRRIVPGPPRLRQYDLVTVSLFHAPQMEHMR